MSTTIATQDAAGPLRGDPAAHRRDARSRARSLLLRGSGAGGCSPPGPWAVTVMWRHRTDPHAERLIEECESFLAGESVSLCEARREPVPVWAWMNVLAHGTEAELRAAAEYRPPNDEGRQALSFVASELVELIDAGVLELEAFQRGRARPPRARRDRVPGHDPVAARSAGGRFARRASREEQARALTTGPREAADGPNRSKVPGERTSQAGS